MSEREASLAERVELLSIWDAGEHPTVEASVAYHHQAHGQGLSLLEYLRAAARFDRTTATRNPSSGTRRGGTVKYKRKNGEFLIEKGGKILSYGRQ